MNGNLMKIRFWQNRLCRYCHITSALVFGSIAGSALAGVAASSVYVSPVEATDKYVAARLVDGDPKTVWIEGKEGEGLGESFVIDLPRGDVKRVVFTPGHGADERMYKKYSHLKVATLEFYTLADNRQLKLIKSQRALFEDTFKVQDVAVEGVKIGEELFGGQVKVILTEVYAGVDFRDTAIAEVKVVMDEFPAQAEVAEVSSTQKGVDQASLADGAKTTAWIAADAALPQSVTLTAQDFGLSAVVVTPGVLKDLKKFKDVARPKDITITVDRYTIKQTLKDTPEAQRIELPAIGGYTGSVFGAVKITIDSVYPGTTSQAPAITEVSLLATNFNL